MPEVETINAIFHHTLKGHLMENHADAAGRRPSHLFDRRPEAKALVQDFVTKHDHLHFLTVKGDTLGIEHGRVDWMRRHAARGLRELACQIAGHPHGDHDDIWYGVPQHVRVTCELAVEAQQKSDQAKRDPEQGSSPVQAVQERLSGFRADRQAQAQASASPQAVRGPSHAAVKPDPAVLSQRLSALRSRGQDATMAGQAVPA